MVPVLLEAIKEQQRMIELLEGTVESLNLTLESSNERYTALQKQIGFFSAELETLRTHTDYSTNK
jgi:ATP-dependent helicase/DNAse subunit B